MVSAWPAPGSPPNTPDTASTERGQGLETDSHRLTQPVVSLHRSPRRHRILIRHRIEHGYLAAMAGVARDSVSCTFREWHRQKVVQESSRTCSVVHKAKLEDAAGILARAERQTPRDTYCLALSGAALPALQHWSFRAIRTYAAAFGLSHEKAHRCRRLRSR